jgi:hypothetical protein
MDDKTKMNYKIVPDTTNGQNYKQLDNGTCYNQKADDKMIQLLEDIRLNETRCRFHWGDTKTGLDWGDDCDVKGRISRSTGSIKIPLLIPNRQSSGGGAILTDCIVKITTTKGNEVLYEHPSYHNRTGE